METNGIVIILTTLSAIVLAFVPPLAKKFEKNINATVVTADNPELVKLNKDRQNCKDRSQKIYNNLVINLSRYILDDSHSDNDTKELNRYIQSAIDVMNEYDTISMSIDEVVADKFKAAS
jgi:hypothetical protein